MSNLKVWYGWAKLNKVRKREAISVIFENGKQSSERTDGFIRKMQNTVYVRYQTDEEAKDAVSKSRMFTEYNIFMDDKAIRNSLDFALWENSEAEAHPKSPWISTNERLPDISVDVFLHARNGSLLVGHLAVFNADKRWIILTDDCWREIDYVDYWMPIPELPKGGGE